MNDCIFCKIVRKEIPSENFVYENDKIMAFLDIAPSSPGHTLVVPKAHYVDLLDTPDDVLAEIITKAKKIAPAVMKGAGAQGFNTIFNTKPAAGQVVFHTHLHIIPRFTNDGLKHWPKIEMSAEEMKKIKEKIVSALK